MSNRGCWELQTIGGKRWMVVEKRPNCINFPIRPKGKFYSSLQALRFQFLGDWRSWNFKIFNKTFFRVVWWYWSHCNILFHNFVPTVTSGSPVIQVSVFATREKMRLNHDYLIRWNFSVKLFLSVTFLYVWCMGLAGAAGPHLSSSSQASGALLTTERRISGDWRLRGTSVNQKAGGGLAAFPSLMNHKKLMNLTHHPGAGMGMSTSATLLCGRKTQPPHLENRSLWFTL